MNKLISFIKGFTKKEVAEVSCVRKIGRQYFYIPKDIENLKNKIDLEPYLAGVFYGELKDGKFRASFPLLDTLARYTDQVATVNKKGETMFLYGNAILPESISSLSQDSGLVLVENEHGEVLGYGEIKKDRNGSRIVSHLFDRSNYLKREEIRPAKKRK